MSPELRAAFKRWARASAALRLYRRRGWNDSAVRFQFDRERAEVYRLLEATEYAENNPTLF